MIIRYAIIDDQEERYTLWYHSKDEAIKSFLKDLRYRPDFKKKVKNLRLKFAQQTTIIQKELKYEEMTNIEKEMIKKGMRK